MRHTWASEQNAWGFIFLYTNLLGDFGQVTFLLWAALSPNIKLGVYTKLQAFFYVLFILFSSIFCLLLFADWGQVKLTQKYDFQTRHCELAHDCNHNNPETEPARLP